MTRQPTNTKNFNAGQFVGGFKKVPRFHVLKCWTPSFEALVDGKKTFELRKNDRGFAEGDVLKLEEWNPDTGYTGRRLDVLVGWTLYNGFGLPEGYCIMSVFPSELTNNGKYVMVWGRDR